MDACSALVVGGVHLGRRGMVIVPRHIWIRRRRDLVIETRTIKTGTRSAQEIVPFPLHTWDTHHSLLEHRFIMHAFFLLFATCLISSSSSSAAAITAAANSTSVASASVAASSINATATVASSAKPSPTSAGVESRSLDDLYALAVAEGGQLVVRAGGDTISQQDAFVQAFQQRFPKMNITMIVDLSKVGTPRYNYCLEHLLICL